MDSETTFTLAIISTIVFFASAFGRIECFIRKDAGSLAFYSIMIFISVISSFIFWTSFYKSI